MNNQEHQLSLLFSQEEIKNTVTHIAQDIVSVDTHLNSIPPLCHPNFERSTGS